MVGGSLLPWLTELLEDALAGPSRAALLATVPHSPYRVLLGTLTNLEDSRDFACSGCCPPCRYIIVNSFAFCLLPFVWYSHGHASCLEARQIVTARTLTCRPGTSQECALKSLTRDGTRQICTKASIVLCQAAEKVSQGYSGSYQHLLVQSSSVLQSSLLLAAAAVSLAVTL